MTIYAICLREKALKVCLAKDLPTGKSLKYRTTHEVIKAWKDNTDDHFTTEVTIPACRSRHDSLEDYLDEKFSELPQFIRIRIYDLYFYPAVKIPSEDYFLSKNLYLVSDAPFKISVGDNEILDLSHIYHNEILAQCVKKILPFIDKVDNPHEFTCSLMTQHVYAWEMEHLTHSEKRELHLLVMKKQAWCAQKMGCKGALGTDFENQTVLLVLTKEGFLLEYSSQEVMV